MKGEMKMLNNLIFFLMGYLLSGFVNYILVEYNKYKKGV